MTEHPLVLTAPGITYPEPEGTDPSKPAAVHCSVRGVWPGRSMRLHRRSPPTPTSHEEIDAFDAGVEYSRGIYPGRAGLHRPGRPER